MLKRLTVKSFAIIEDLNIEFKNKMTVLTGQTGAGKSLIIDTISLLLGARADSDMIRYGDEKAIVEGEFFYDNSRIDDLLSQYEISKQKSLIIRREIANNGKNNIKINGTNVNLQILKNIAILLADIHVQHDTYRLFNQDTYLSFIDPIDDDKFNKLFNDYSYSLMNYQKSLKTYQEIAKGKKSGEEKLEFLEFQKKELEELNLSPDEDIILEEKINKLANYDKIFTNLNECYLALENDYFSIDNIYEAHDKLQKIKSFDESFAADSEKLSDCYYVIEEIKHNVKRAIDNLDFDEEELNLLNERLNNIEATKKKYKLNVNEIIQYLEKIRIEIGMVTNYDEILADALQTVKNSHEKLVKQAISLSNLRKGIAKDIEKIIVQELRDLDLANTDFKIVFKDMDLNDALNQTPFQANGIDELEFMISLNKGEPLKPLHKTASGGELSRIMLAFKAYFSKISHLSLIVFDEIDSGVSGNTAMKIAEKMHKISDDTQVLCITHLPQVASVGDNHLFIYKTEENNRTKTNIVELDYEKRVEEIAKMLSGNKMSKYALEHAKELLDANLNK